MFDLFGVPWARVGLEHVQAFLAEAQDDEGVTWEAKADDDDERKRPPGEEPGRLHPRTIQKATSAFANQLGGYLVLGARWDKSERRWLLAGFVPPESEAGTWLDNVVGSLRPPPRRDVRTWHLGGERWVAVIRVEPVDEPPCMTPHGHVYERVSGKSVRVADPALLDRLIRRGRERRAYAEASAQEAALVAVERATRQPTWSVKLALALAPIGRETEDVSSRLFAESYEAALGEALARFVPAGETPEVGVVTRQSSLAAVGVITSARAFDWSEWAVSSHWTGAVAACATFSRDAIPAPLPADQTVFAPAYREVEALVQRLGGYGPAHLAVLACRAPDHTDGRIDGKFVAPEQRPQPPTGLFAGLPQSDPTVIGRWVSIGGPRDETLASVTRELHRAAGRRSPEPDEETSDQPVE
jgi:hypothetical protein